MRLNAAPMQGGVPSNCKRPLQTAAAQPRPQQLSHPSIRTAAVVQGASVANAGSPPGSLAAFSQGGGGMVRTRSPTLLSTTASPPHDENSSEAERWEPSALFLAGSDAQSWNPDARPQPAPWQLGVGRSAAGGASHATSAPDQASAVSTQGSNTTVFKDGVDISGRSHPTPRSPVPSHSGGAAENIAARMRELKRQGERAMEAVHKCVKEIPRPRPPEDGSMTARTALSRPSEMSPGNAQLSRSPQSAHCHRKEQSPQLPPSADVAAGLAMPPRMTTPRAKGIARDPSFPKKVDSGGEVSTQYTASSTPTGSAVSTLHDAVLSSAMQGGGAADAVPSAHAGSRSPSVSQSNPMAGLDRLDPLHSVILKMRSSGSDIGSSGRAELREVAEQSEREPSDATTPDRSRSEIFGLRAEIERLRSESKMRRATTSLASDVGSRCTMNASAPALLGSQQRVGANKADSISDSCSSVHRVGEDLNAMLGGAMGAPTSDGFQQQLFEVLLALRQEQRGREALSQTVNDVERRVSEGLASIGEMTSAQMATDSATDNMLNALKSSVDELKERCAWPPQSVTDAEGMQAATVAEAVWQSHTSLEHLKGLQEGMQRQHEEQMKHLDTLTSWMQQQQQRLDDGLSNLGTGREKQEAWEASIQSVRNSISELSTSNLGSLRTLDGQLQEAVAGLRGVECQLQAFQGEQLWIKETLRGVGDQQRQLQGGSVGEAAAKLQVMEGKLQAVQREQSQVQEGLRAVEAVQQQLLAAGVAGASNDRDYQLAAVKRLEGQLEIMKSEHVQIKEAIQAVQQQLAGVVGASSDRDYQLAAMKNLEGQLEIMKSEHVRIREAIQAGCICGGGASAPSKGNGNARCQKEEPVPPARETAMPDAKNCFVSGRADEVVPGTERQGAIQTELGALAGIINRLSERIERIESRGTDAPVASPSAARSVNRSPEPVARAYADIEAAPGTGPVLQKQLASLADNVQRLSMGTVSTGSGSAGPASSCPSSSAPGSVGPGNGREDAGTSRSDHPERAVGGPYPLALQALLERKAPSPRRWLMEPLSVSVSRSDVVTGAVPPRS